MGLIKWVVGMLAVFAPTLVAKQNATQLSIGVLVGLFVFCLRVRHLGRGMSSNAPKTHGLSRLNVHSREVNDSLYELHKPVSITPSVRVIFFHGLPLGDFLEAHLSTWESGDGSCIWPTWLVADQQFVDAEILSVSYSKCLMKPSSGSFDMSLIGENLTADLIDQLANCPIVLVGHCIGGLVIKQLCLQAHDKLHMAPESEKDPKLEAFLGNIRGIFYYGTPHHGSDDLADAAEKMGSPLFEYVKSLSEKAARMNSRFDELHHKLYPKWQIHGLGESKRTKLGRFKNVLLVSEGSARAGGFRLLPEDHYSICKPQSRSSTSFTALVRLLNTIMSNWKEEIKTRDETRKQEEATAQDKARPHNLQRLPEHIKGVDVLLQQVKAELKNCKTLGFVGMGGIGKTTLAKAVFNELGYTFEYTCFVGVITGIEELKEVVWKNMHCNGKKVGEKEEWFSLRGKKLLLVLDDISSNQGATCCSDVLSDIAIDTSPESRFILTSRDNDLLKNFGGVYKVPLLDKNNSQQLFMSYAFPGQASPPPKFAILIGLIVEKCEGLPLTLEVLGKYLKGEVIHGVWKQTHDALIKADQTLQTFDERLWAKLRPSFDGLREDEKKMFLDATTFFVYGQFSLREAKAAWKKVYPHSELRWKILVDRSLVDNVEEDERITVHQQLQSLGRMIAAECDSSFCRVWEEPMTSKLLQSPDQVGNKELYSLQMERSVRGDTDVIHIARQALPKLKELRFLDITAPVVIDGSREDDPSLNALLVLDCVGLPIFNLALQSRLVVLKLSLPDVEKLPTSIGQLSSLEIFVILDAEELKSLPDEIGRLSLLETLELKYCGSLQTLPETFGQLSKLKNLEFFECRSFCALPERFGDLKALVTLAFDHCRELKTLPEFSGNLKSLRKLYFTDCCLESLPESFGKLSTLVELELIDCKHMWSLIPFGQLMELQHLKIGREYKFGGMDSMPGSMAKLRALRHLVVDSVSAKSIPDYINLDMPSLHTLELTMLPYVKVLPAWLGNIGVIPLALSRKVFEKQKGCFCLTYEEEAISSESIVKLLHSYAMKKVRKADYEGALEDLCPGNLGELKFQWKGFLLQEKGILKRFIGNLHGALEDLSAALEVFSQANNLKYAYDCYKQMGFVNFLLKNLDDAKKDGTMALQILSRYGLHSVFSPSLGDESAAYMHFRLKGLKEMKEERKASPYSEVMESVSARDFSTALATWNAFDATVSGYSDRVYFFQERGVLKRMAGDWQGALEDLTAALEIDEDHYECLKHRGHVKHLLGDNDGARIDAERCKAMKCANPRLGGLKVEFLEFRLT